MAATWFSTLPTDYNGSASFTYTVRDNGTTAGAADFKTSTATASFAIVAVNNAPDSVDDSLASVAEGSGRARIELSGLLTNDTAGAADESGQTLTIIGVSGGVGGTVELDGTRSCLRRTLNSTDWPALCIRFRTTA